MTNVTPFTGTTRLSLDPARVLNAAVEAKIKTAVVIGWDDDGRFYFASSESDGPEVLWLLEMAKKKLLESGE